MNWYILIPVGIAAIVLMIFLIVRNQKDEKELENQLNEDYPKPKNDEGDIIVEDTTK